MEVDKQMDEVADPDLSAAPEEAAVPLPLRGPLGEGIYLGFGTLGYTFCSPIMFLH